MNRPKVLTLLLACLLAESAVNAEKQIKLEDIEKDNLKSAQQAKYEKELQQYAQYQQQPSAYDPQLYAQQPSIQQYQGAYPQQYYVPQQYLQQPIYTGGYTAVPSNSIAQGYSNHPFQAYIGQQLAAGVGQPQSQPIVMAISAPALAAFQQQAYYQASVLPKMLSNLQYYPQGNQQQLFYASQPTAQEQPSSQAPSQPVVYTAAQSYVPSFNPLPPSSSTKLSAASAYSSQPQYISTAPQTFPSAYHTQQNAYTPSYPTPTPYTPSPIYTNQDTPPFVAIKAAPQNFVSTAAQYQPTTISPLQNKYLNSPQYLAQNYNTIQSSQLSPKGSFPVGIKSTASPSIKIASSGGYLTSNPHANQGLNPYQTYRGLSG